tara:strand:- start:2463 stop:3644 length:1182 start_codon:yes stop_codon:yes gene_type:complete
MKIQFKILLLMLITSVAGYGQNHKILEESFSVNENTSVVLNFENIYVAIEESTDGKIHFDYIMEFEGFSKKEMQEKLKEVSVKVSNFDNGVTLNAKSENQINFVSYEIDAEYGITYSGDFTGKKKDTILRKTKDSLLSEIRYNNKVQWSGNPLKFINNKFKKLDKDGNLSNIRKGNMNILRSQFLIKIPPFVKLNINGKNSGIHFRNDLPNEISVKLKSGTLKTKSLFNNYNKVIIDDANFEVETISGGDYEFINVKNGKIASIKNAKIKSEFSKVEIGEIAKHTTITDFNSEYWFYNWSQDFERFNLYSEYSKIHFWYPKANHSLKVIGNNTKNLVGNNKFEINMQPTSKGEKYTMMVKKPHSGEKLSGQIFFDIVHGIIYSHNDSIKKIND